jgi:arylsulfatase A-like enzyme/tetratricopeptide (TPR) repeat protein
VRLSLFRAPIVTALLCETLVACGGKSIDLIRSTDRNVLLITIDTLRAGALGVDGGPARTPNMDALAAAGVRFSFAHAHAVLTLPSHASILTGVYPFQHGYRINAGSTLGPGAETLATRLKENGFETGAFIGAFPLDARFGLTAGFDIYDGRFDDTSGAAEFLLPERPATAVVSRAIDWIRRRDGRWFTWVHVFEPHAPYRPPPPFDRDYAGNPYYGEVAAADRALGPLLAAARASSRPTLVVLTGDHGEALGDHAEITHGLFAYESTLRVPFVIADAGATARTPAGGVVSRAPASHVDIVPTVLDALGMPVPGDLPGHSLRTGAGRDALAARTSYFEAVSSTLDYGWAPLTGVLVGQEKYIDLPIAELYDLERDPGESNNLFVRSAERSRALATRLAEFRAPGPVAQQAPPDVAARLQALGYVSGSSAQKAAYTEQDDPKRLVDLDRTMHEAVVLDTAGRLEEAIARYREVLARRPEMIATAGHLAFDLWRTGSQAAAIDTLQSALRSAAPTPAAQTQLGTYLLETGRTVDAIEWLQLAVASSPTLDALNALGIAYARSRRPHEALAMFARSLAIDPSNGATHENIGAVHLDAGRLPDAKAAFEQAVAANPDSSQAHSGLAMTEIRSGDRKTAIEHWKRAVEIQPSNFDALYDLGMQLAQAGQTELARRYLEQFVRTAPPAEYRKEIDKASALLRRF